MEALILGLLWSETVLQCLPQHCRVDHYLMLTKSTEDNFIVRTVMYNICLNSSNSIYVKVPLGTLCRNCFVIGKGNL
jgi:hypothetical protein